MSAYYNEFKPETAAMLRQLIKDGLIADGEVDSRSITEVKANEIRGFTQCHFFAGIGGWSVALRQAGWSDDRPVWTGSCPCQPFSAAGKKEGGGDDRHLWPTWFNLIRECAPPKVYGEQVASAISHGWLDGVSSDMEKEKYALGAAVLPACAVNAPTERLRLWWHANGLDRHPQSGREEEITEIHNGAAPKCLANSEGGFWNSHRWFGCADGKRRRIPSIKSGIQLMVDGFPKRMELINAAGNAIVPEVAARFIQANM